jgi:small subunit ribosomal protein S2
MAQITIKEMLDAGVHFGHQTQRWNPKMKPYVYTNRGGIHIIDLQKSVSAARRATKFIAEISSRGGRLIFVGTKKQAVTPIKNAAEKCGQYYMTKRWLGGTLTNFTTIKSSIDRLKKIDRMRENDELAYFSKKEQSKIEKEYTKLLAFLEGIKDMKEAPAAMFVVDINKEHIAVKEAKKLGIPIIAIADTNTNPEEVDFPIPGNDDAIRAIELFANMVADTYLEGAKDYEKFIQEEAQKESEAPKVEASKSSNKNADVNASGVDVVKKVSKVRKFVAVGTAEDVEIQMELESKKEDEPVETTGSTETTETEAKK